MGGSAKVTIAGAGALGLSAAVALADAGCRVRVFDPRPAASASAIAAGMLAPAFEAVLDDAARPHLDLLLHARDLWPAFAARTGVVLDRSGALAAGSGAWVVGVAGGLADLGLAHEPLDAAGLQARAPGLRAAAGVFTPDDWRLDPAQALEALRAAALAAGVAFVDEAWTGEEGAQAGADVVVLATGAAGEGLAPELSALTPIKGQLLRVAAPSTGGAVLRGEGVYVAPGPGALTIGATMEPGRADTDLDPPRLEALRAAAARLLPGLADAPAQGFAAVRAATPDGLPLVGWSRTPGRLLAAGARRNGWLLAPLVAQILTAHVLGRDSGPIGASLDPARVHT